jgi:hypothetical protein
VGILDMEQPCTKHILAQYRGVCPQCKGLSINHGTDVLPSLLDLIPSGIRHRITTGSGQEGRLHSGLSDRLGWIVDKG